MEEGSEVPGRKDLAICPYTITHNNIAELIPKEFRFGNSSTKITDHFFTKRFGKVGPGIPQSTTNKYYQDDSNPETILFGNQRTGATKTYSKIVKFGSVIMLCAMVLLILKRRRRDFGVYSKVPYKW